MSNEIQLDEEMQRQAKIFAYGINTDFWKETKKMLGDLASAAKDALVTVDPTDVSTVSQCQATVKVVQQLISAVEDTAGLLSV